MYQVEHGYAVSAPQCPVPASIPAPQQERDKTTKFSRSASGTNLPNGRIGMTASFPLPMGPRFASSGDTAIILGTAVVINRPRAGWQGAICCPAQLCSASGGKGVEEGEPTGKMIGNSLTLYSWARRGSTQYAPPLGSTSHQDSHSSRAEPAAIKT